MSSAFYHFFLSPSLHRALDFSRPPPEIEKQLGRDDDDDDSSQSQPENAAAATAATRLQSLTSGVSSRLAPDQRKEKQEEGEPGRVARLKQRPC